MPATEQTWRDIKLLHVIFGVSGALLLLTTLWMFAADHDREWKNFQITGRNVDLRTNDWRELQAKNDEYFKSHEQVETALAEARSRAFDEGAVERFWDEANAELNGKAGDAHGWERSRFDGKLKQLAGKASVAREKRNVLRDVEDELQQATQAIGAARQQLTAAGADDALRDAAQEAIAGAEKRLADARGEVAVARGELLRAEKEASKSRDEALAILKAVVKVARDSEDIALQERKFASANFDAARAKLDIGVRDNLPRAEMEQLQVEVDKKQALVQSLQRGYQELRARRSNLKKALEALTRDEDELKKKQADNEATLKQLKTASLERRSNFLDFDSGVPLPGKRWLELPILDAFNSPLKVNNLWSDGLMHKYGSFSYVRRFDRCTTCHQSIERTAPGSAIDPATVHASEITLALASPDKAEIDSLEVDDEWLADPTLLSIPAVQGRPTAAQLRELRVEKLYGLILAEQGLVVREDVTVKMVRPKSRAAVASAPSVSETRTSDELRDGVLDPGEELDSPIAANGLRVGDVIVQVNGSPVRDRQRTIERLDEAARAHEPLALTVRRGLAHPYVSHPRLDLFVGSLSPHKMSQFACTVCHDGQGSATEFRWTSHTPNDDLQRVEWANKHGWFDNHHWVFPMHAKRFVESACLKCHHDVNSLAPSARFPEAPAPKLSYGADLIRKMGCFGCHEINGYDGPKRRVGPDLRLEPNSFAAAQQLMHAPDTGFDKLTPAERGWIQELVDHPDRDDVRHHIHQLIREDAKSEEPRLSLYVHAKLEPLFRDVDSPGKMRKTGPSLRFVGHKADAAFLFDWIRQPANFRPDTRMPQFFGLWDHLPRQTLAREKHELEEEQKVLKKRGKKRNASRLAEIDRDLERVHEQLHNTKAKESEYEPLEVFGIVTYLLQRTQPFAYLKPAEVSDSTREEKIERGKILFQERGCLACHSHKDFPDAKELRGPQEIVQGPDLSRVGDKFSPTRLEGGRQWLYSWIRKPNRYHARSVMPDLFLEPIPITDDKGEVTHTIDAADDLVEYLLAGSTDGWQPKADTIASASEVDVKMLDEFVELNLREAFDMARARAYTVRGIPAELRGEIKGVESELLVDDGGVVSREQKLIYLGRKSISKYGCYACHDIPGFEDAKPIGTGLNEWGRKDPAKLAFEHIDHYLHLRGGSQVDHYYEAPEIDAEFYEHQLKAGNRIGFIYQKLHEPRSYDYRKTTNKEFNERLRMPQFPLTHEQREAIVTFVLGLVADPPTAKYVYQPDARSEALIAGRNVIEKYNCTGCHMFEAEQWKVSFPSGRFPEPVATPTFPFMASSVPTDELARSAQPDGRNLLRATLVGVPSLDEKDGKPVVYDSSGDPTSQSDADAKFDKAKVEYDFTLWKPTVLEGQVYEIGQVIRNVPGEAIEQRIPSEGGYLAKYLGPHLVTRAQQGVAALGRPGNPNARGTETWAWVPPPLLGEGQKVQSKWLYEFLLDPHPIRPAVVLRMPKFNMSSDEATALVNYFAAMDNADYPYEFDNRRRNTHLADVEDRYRRIARDAGDSEGSRFDHTMRILIDKKSGCVQCHAVGDYSVAPKGPNLQLVYQRLRPEYVRRWIARPASVLPYTTMPENVKYNPTNPDEDGFIVKQGSKNMKYVHGTSTEQLDSLVDLLMNYDEYMKRRTSVTSLVNEANPPDAATGGTSGAE